MSDPAYFSLDGDDLVPTELATGPWGPGTMNGQVVGALLARAAEATIGGDGFRGARLTVDLVRMATLDPLRTSVDVLRDGRRLRLADATLVQGGREVAHARAVFVRGGAAAGGEVWRAESRMPAPPTGPDAPRMWASTDHDGSGAADFDAWHDPARSKYVWFRLEQPLVAGEEVSGFVRACFAGDTTSPLTNWGSAGLQHINADYTVALVREPVGPWVGLEGRDHLDADGVSVGTTTLHDASGPIGTSVATALVTDVPLQIPGSATP